MGFILVHMIGKKGHEDIPCLIAVKEIISVLEIEGIVYIQMERDWKGRILIGCPFRESMWEILEKIKYAANGDLK